MCEHIHLNICLIIKLLFVSNDLQSNIFLCFMIETLQSLPKTSFPKWRNNFKPIGYMIFKNNIVVSPLIIIPIVKLIPNGSIYFLCIRANEINFFKVQYLPLFVICQKCLKSSDRSTRLQRKKVLINLRNVGFFLLFFCWRLIALIFG